jgi:hypothetical protein
MHNQNDERKESRQEKFTCLLSSEGAALGQACFSTGRLAKDGRAAGADDDGLCVREDSRDCEAAGALDVHEERSGSRDKVLLRVKSTSSTILERILSQMMIGAYLKLVLASLCGWGWVEEIYCENLNRQHHVSL